MWVFLFTGGSVTHYYFIKLYHEVLHDPKMGQLPDRLWRRCIELFLLAGENDKEGELPNMRSMCWTLRVDQEELETDMEQLEDLGILTLGDHDKWIVTNFVKRQAKQTGAERVERYRERKRKEDNTVTNSYKNVTQPVTNTVPDIDIDIDIEVDKDTEVETEKSAAAVFQLYENEISLLTPMLSDKINSWIDDYPELWITDAIGEAVINNVRKPSYIEAILKNWQANGRTNGGGKKKQGDAQAKDYVGGQYSEFIDH